MFTLAIAGRPNVGKSTLFNRLARKHLAIVNDTPGVTRDWRETPANLMGMQIRLIDTAGLEEKFDDSIQGKMRKQTESALKHADAILFMVDGRAGITPLDEHFAGWLRKQGLPIILGVNKCEHERAATAAIAESYKLGLGDPIIMSAEHGVGMDMLYESIKHLIPAEPEPEETDEEDGDADGNIDDLEGLEDYEFIDHDADDETKPIKVAIVGRPNVGKSTLLNALLGVERAMTSPEAGTTRDAISAHWEFKGRSIRLVDTAGMRKKGKIFDPIEKMSVDDSLRAIRLAQVVILTLDGNQTMDKQDLLIAEHALDEGRALIIAVNKWDEVEDCAKALEKINDRLMASLAQVPGVPVVTMSALRGKNLDRLMDEVLRIYGVWNGRVPTARLNRWLADMESQHPAPMANGKPNRLKYIAQIKTRPPTFALWTSRPGDLPDTYKRYLVNGLRDTYDLEGIPVRIIVRASKNPYVS